MGINKKVCVLVLIFCFLFLFVAGVFVFADSYNGDIYFTLPYMVYTTGERIELKGAIYLANYSDNGTLVSASSVLSGATINFSIKYENGTIYNNYTFTSDSNGEFYSRSNYYASATLINAPSSSGNYNIRAEYKDASNSTWFSEVQIKVVNQTIDSLDVSPGRAIYNPSETILIEIAAVQLIGDRVLFKSNVSVNGSVRDSTKTILSSFNCTTESNGKCVISVSGPSSYGQYIIELDSFKAFSSFYVVPFSSSVYMKDELGQSLKNVYAVGEQARVEVSVANASDSDVYTFSGYIADSSGNNIRTINSSTLNANNSFTNSFLFTVDALTFSYGSYIAHVAISKSGDGSINSSASFEVRDWALSVNKKTSGSGFEYGYSIFSNSTMKFEVYPTYRANGSVIANASILYFTTELKDSLGNVISSTNVSWNASCGSGGCYELSMNSPVNIDKYALEVTFSYSGSTRKESRIINVINMAMSAQSTNKDGAIKELFGSNEYVYISLTAHNLTMSSLNLTNAEVFIVSYMNGSELSYTQVGNFDLVNASNSAYEWAWNVSSQLIKMDVPKAGGLYDAFLFGNNQSVGSVTKFIVNPYDICSVPKNTPGQVTSGYYYVWQFKTTDTVYFELKATQANNPLGRATVSNGTNASSGAYGMGSACNVDTATKQVVENASISVEEVRNVESGIAQSINSSESICQASDSSGGYTCTVKPLSKFDGGMSLVKFRIIGKDGTEDISYGVFEARAFYLYGWSNVWLNNPNSNISFSVRLYEAGSSWWSSYGGSGGLSGTIKLKKVEYQGRDGEWIWPPVSYDYNASAVNSSSVTSGLGVINLSAAYAPGGRWKTGYYRAIIEGTTSSGDVDYGYVWFGIKMWDVYGSPIECTANGCGYKSYFNSKENITLYVKVSNAGNAYSWNDNGGQNLGGNITISVEKLQDCRTWPCKELNSSVYSASTISVNESSPWYWGANINNQSRYILQINNSVGSWGTGWYSVVLNVNGSDSGYAWFNTIAFYVETQPTDENGSNYVYNIKPGKPMYFNVTTVKNYKNGYWNGNNYYRYNNSDYVNTTVDDISLRMWDEETYRTREFNYPEVLNVTSLNVRGNALVNLSYLNGSWPVGYYWGELSLKNIANETSTGWLWFRVQPFRVETSTQSSNVDEDQCVNTTIYIYEPSWYSNTYLYGNYSITSIYEEIWSYSSVQRISYTNYTSDTFNATKNILLCPNNGTWGSGSWGGYHYPRITIRDNSDNSTQVGWMYFRAVPFQTSWGSVVGGSNKLTSENIVVPVTLSRSSGASTRGNLSRLYQWRYDNYMSTQEEYNFSIGSCYSNVSRQCVVNGTQNVTIYAPSGGWRVGYNYIYANWNKESSSSQIIEDWSGIYIEGREAYNGYYANVDTNGYYKFDFRDNENFSIKLYVRNSNYNSVDVNITNVYYSNTGNCWSEWCRSYDTATWTLVNATGNQTTNGQAIIVIHKPISSNWTRGYYHIKAGISGSAGIASITGGDLRVKDFISPNISIELPLNNQSITSSAFLAVANTSENSNCYFYILDYNSFSNWLCGNLTNSNLSSQMLESCNRTKYGYSNSTSTYYMWVSDYYMYSSTATTSTWFSGATGLTTGGLNHSYAFNVTNWSAQDYGLYVYCYDADSNGGYSHVAFRVNVTRNESNVPPLVTINSPTNNKYYNTSSVTFNFSLDKNGSCVYSLNYGALNYTMTNTNNRHFNATNTSMYNGNHTVYAYCNDTYGNWNKTIYSSFVVDTVYPLISYGSRTSADLANLTGNSIYINVTWTESNFGNLTISVYNQSARVNSTFTSSVASWASFGMNYSGLAYGNYTFNVTIIDLAGNTNTTATRFVNLSAS